MRSTSRDSERRERSRAGCEPVAAPTFKPPPSTLAPAQASRHRANRRRDCSAESRSTFDMMRNLITLEAWYGRQIAHHPRAASAAARELTQLLPNTDEESASLVAALHAFIRRVHGSAPDDPSAPAPYGVPPRPACWVPIFGLSL